jgi:hypothetical protein
VAKDPERCPYKVVFGDAEREKAEIGTDVDRDERESELPPG